jgi:hypothetical protein
MNDAVGDASFTDASCYIRQDNGEGGEEADQEGSNDLTEGKVGDFLRGCKEVDY